MPINRKVLVDIAVAFNSVMKLNPMINYNDDISDADLLKRIVLDSSELKPGDLFPDKIIDHLNELKINHPLRKRSEHTRFELNFYDNNKPEISTKKLISREESIVRTLKRAWQTLDGWTTRSNKFYYEKGGNDNEVHAKKMIKASLRYLITCGFCETRGTGKDEEYRISSIYLKFREQEADDA
jgi:hypothetical protein